jgi:hypothetical protein
LGLPHPILSTTPLHRAASPPSLADHIVVELNAQGVVVFLFSLSEIRVRANFRKLTGTAAMLLKEDTLAIFTSTIYHRHPVGSSTY